MVKVHKMMLSLAASASVLSGVSQAQAADLGGNCCADLEERIADLEATTARKGNRKVSLTVSGFVHQSIMFWDDSQEKNVYIGDNSTAYSRFRFVGKAKINADWSAGYLLELGAYSARSEEWTSTNDDGGSAVNVRHSAWWIENKNFGKVWVGQTSQATDGITEINLANAGHFANQSTGVATIGAFNAFDKSNPANTRTVRLFMGGNNTDSAQIGEGNRRNLVKYETPALAGFVASAAFGEDDMWDVALRYAGEFSGFKLAFGVGYEQTTEGPVGSGSATASERNCVGPVGTDTGSDVKCSQIGLSGAVMHVATGLYVHGAYGHRWDDHAGKAVGTTNLGSERTQYYIQGGIEQNWLGFGKTTAFGEYQHWEGGATAGLARKSEASMWGIGVNQAIDAAAMDLYVKYNQYYDLSETTSVGVTTSYSDVKTFIAGGRIQF